MTDIEHILATANFVDAEARAECERRLTAAIGNPVIEYDELLKRLDDTDDDVCRELPINTAGSCQEAAEAIRALQHRVEAAEANLASTESERAHHAMTAGCLRTDLEYANAEIARLREKITQWIDMTDNCAGVPRNPDSLPMMLLYEFRAALDAPQSIEGK